MSFENRKREYERLVESGRFEQIPESLIKEFGKPMPKAKEEAPHDQAKPVNAPQKKEIKRKRK